MLFYEVTQISRRDSMAGRNSWTRKPIIHFQQAGVLQGFAELAAAAVARLHGNCAAGSIPSGQGV